MQKLETQKRELVPIYDARASFYGKCQIIEVYKNGYKVGAFLRSYKSVVAGVTYGTPEKNNFYINEKIDPYLLWSQTTLRHIKEFYRQFFKNKEITKADLQKRAIIKPFDYLLIEERNNGEDERRSLVEEKQLYRATSPETRKFFKNMFEGYKERTKASREGLELLTSSVYGIQNYYYYNIDRICEEA